MHFALPSKTSHPPYARASTGASANFRRQKQVQIAGYVVLALLTFYLALKSLLYLTAPGEIEDGVAAIEGRQDIVLVTVFDNDTMSEDYIRLVRANREDYAARHGIDNAETPEAHAEC